MFNTANLSPMQLGRLNAALDKLYRYSDGVRTLRANIERLAAIGKLEKAEYDGTVDWNRRRFNRMNAAEQRAYEARLKAKRYYTINGHHVPKIVYDALAA